VVGLDYSNREQLAIQLVSRRGIPVVRLCKVQPIFNCPWGDQCWKDFFLSSLKPLYLEKLK